jgi:Tfp pilus assembly protein PilO
VKRLASQPILAGCAAAAIILALWWQMLWSPQGAKISQAQRREQDASTALFSAQQRVAHLKHLSTQADAFNTLGKRLADAVPDTDALDQFLPQLNQLARQASVALPTVSLGGAPGGAAGKGAAATTIPLQFSVSGGYFNIERFLSSLRDSPRLIMVDTVSVNRGADLAPGAPGSGGDGTALTASISARIFAGQLGTAAPAPAPVALAPVPDKPAAAPPLATGFGDAVNKAKTTAGAASSSANATAANAAATAGGSP